LTKVRRTSSDQRRRSRRTSKLPRSLKLLSQRLQANLGSSVTSRTGLSTLTGTKHSGTAESLIDRSLRKRLLFLGALSN
jgi:hypothetical protein